MLPATASWHGYSPNPTLLWLHAPLWLQLLISQILIRLLQLLRLETAIMARQLSCWSWCNSHLPKDITAIPDPWFHAVPQLLFLLPPAQPMATATFHSFSCCHSRKLLLPATTTEPSSDSCCYHMTSTTSTPWCQYPHPQHVTSHCSLLLLLYQSSILSPAISIKLWYLDLYHTILILSHLS